MAKPADVERVGRLAIHLLTARGQSTLAFTPGHVHQLQDAIGHALLVDEMVALLLDDEGARADVHAVALRRTK